MENQALTPFLATGFLSRSYNFLCASGFEGSVGYAAAAQRSWCNPSVCGFIDCDVAELPACGIVEPLVLAFSFSLLP